MSSLRQSLQIQNIPNRWALAQSLNRDSKIPEESLRVIFEKTMDDLKSLSSKKFEPSLKERIWNKTSQYPLETLQNTFFLEFCSLILEDFKDDEVNTMLNKCKKTKTTKTKALNTRLETARDKKIQLVVNSVIEKADSIKRNFVFQIIGALKKEGIKFSPPKKSIT